MSKFDDIDYGEIGPLHTPHGLHCSTLELMRFINPPKASPRTKDLIESLVQNDKINKKEKLAPLDPMRNPILGKGETNALVGTKAWKDKIIRHPKPAQKQLVGGKLVVSGQNGGRPGSSGSENTVSSKNSPLKISHAPSSVVSSRVSSWNEQSSASSRKSQSTNQQNIDRLSTSTSRSKKDDLFRLQNEKIELQTELYNITRKLNRKYSKTRSKPAEHEKGSSGDKIKALAKVWSSPALTPGERYHAYMDSRYLTQTSADYHEKPLPSRDEGGGKHHRKYNMHTKYSKALKQTLPALRGRF